MKRTGLYPYGAVFAIMVCISVVTLAVSMIVSHKPQDASSIRFDRHPGQYLFDPKQDITVQELAQSISVMLAGPEFLPGIRPGYDSLPASAKRHWKEPIDGPAPAQPSRDKPLIVPGAPVPHQDAPKF